MALMAVVDGLDRLFEADGDEEADDDGDNVGEKSRQECVAAWGWVDVEHGVAPGGMD
jgi:hypothetical protein